MESLTQSIAENNEFSPYFDTLRAERQNYEQIQELLNRELEEYIKIGVILNQNLIAEKLFRVTVKICDSIIDLFKLGVCQLTENFNGENCKYYIVEIHVSSLLTTKIFGGFWYASVCVKNEKTCVYKIVKLNLIPSNTFKVIVPFPQSIEPAVVDTIFFATAETFWPNLKMNSTSVDISYHFTPFKDTKIHKTLQPNPVFEISKLYTDRLKLKPSKPFFEYSFSCKKNHRQFLEMILKNCYHRLDVNQLQILVSSSELLDLQLTISDTKSSITFDIKNKVLRIFSRLEELCRIKKYIIANIDNEDSVVNNSILVSLQNLRKQLRAEQSKDNIDLGAVKIMYREYKDLIAKMPV